MADFNALDQDALERARARAQKDETRPHAVSARFDERSRRIIVALDTGMEVKFDPALVEALADAENHHLAGVSIEGVGSTLRFPALDVDVTVSRLIARLEQCRLLPTCAK